MYCDTPSTKAMCVSQPPTPYRGAPWPCRRAMSSVVSQPCCASCHDSTYCIATHLANQTARLSRYKDCIVTQPPAASPSLLSRYKTFYLDTLARCCTCPCAQPAVAWPPLAMSQPCHVRIVGVAGHVVAQSPAPRPACCVTLCHDTKIVS